MTFNVWQRGLIIGRISAATLLDAVQIAKRQYKSFRLSVNC